MILQYLNSNEKYEVGYCILNENIIQIIPSSKDFKIKKSGFKLINLLDEIQVDCSEYVTVYDSSDENKLVCFSNNNTTWTEENDPRRFNILTAKVKEIKQELADSDYKVIKNYEASMAGKELPYDPEELYNSRQLLRDECNRLEEIIDGLKVKNTSFIEYF